MNMKVYAVWYRFPKVSEVQSKVVVRDELEELKKTCTIIRVIEMAGAGVTARELGEEPDARDDKLDYLKKDPTPLFQKYGGRAKMHPFNDANLSPACHPAAPERILFLGAGDYSMAQCYILHEELENALGIQSGLQQGGQPYPGCDIDTIKHFLERLSNCFNVKIKFEN